VLLLLALVSSALAGEACAALFSLIIVTVGCGSRLRGGCALTGASAQSVGGVPDNMCTVGWQLCCFRCCIWLRIHDVNAVCGSGVAVHVVSRVVSGKPQGLLCAVLTGDRVACAAAMLCCACVRVSRFQYIAKVNRPCWRSVGPDRAAGHAV
jgi:hypothetical protein